MEPTRSNRLQSNSTSPSLASLLNPTSPLPTLPLPTTTTTTTTTATTTTTHSQPSSPSHTISNSRPSKRLKTNLHHSNSPTTHHQARPLTSSEIPITNQRSTSIQSDSNHLNQSTTSKNPSITSPHSHHQHLSISHSRPSTSKPDQLNPHRSASHPIISSTRLQSDHHQPISTGSIEESEADSNSTIPETHSSINPSDPSRPPSITPTLSNLELQRSHSLPTAITESNHLHLHPHPLQTSNPIQSSSEHPSDPSIPSDLIHPNSTDLSMNLESSKNPVEGLEESIFGIGAYDDFIASIGRFIWHHAKPYCERNEGHLIEVEAKLGTIKPKNGRGERMYFPVENESALINMESNRFETNMTERQHKSFNELLNIRVMETNENKYKGSKIKYSHLKDIDEFYDHRIRVRRSQTNGEIKESIIKEKLGSIDVTCPSRLFDFRVSVNLERPAPLPPSDAIPHYRRIKDRLSYEHQICQIDLTQVRTDDPNVQIQHELEVEIKDIQTLLKLGFDWNEGEGDPTYLTYLNVWLNNVRLLIRNSIEP